MPDSLDRLTSARHHDPFEILGLHPAPEGWVLRVFRPAAQSVSLRLPGGDQPLQTTHHDGLFEWRGALAPMRPWRLLIVEGEQSFEIVDPYAFGPLLSDQELYLYNEGRLLESWRSLGSHFMQIDDVWGVRFAVWAPNAERVSVIGNFNNWDGRLHAMRVRGGSGIWELFIPGLQPGDLYKMEIRNRASSEVMVKMDPFAQAFELRPGTAAIVLAPSCFSWNDGEWMKARAQSDWLHAPMNIYELHAPSWRQHPNGNFYTWNDLTESLIPYVLELGYTHIELLPITEHPLDASWGYQTTGYFAPTSRLGSADEFKAFIDACHGAGLGVILDWVPGHFPQDRWALARYDGSALFEHEDPRLGLHQEWGTHVFNYGRVEIKGFLLASACYWLSEFHLDGLRVDAVASMLYLDYSRKAGEWLPNKFGGRENIEAVEFLREMNTVVHERFPGALTFAEESTAWPMVSRPVYLGGLGFSMKWNMGWMNDTLSYIHLDSVYRRYNHNNLTFGQLYAYTENFVLPFSHDEVVHGKGSLLAKMPGDAWQQFANMRLLFSYQTCVPGRKLNFMGNEFAQGREWSEKWELDWQQASNPLHAGIHDCVRDLNRLYRDLPALHELDFDSAGFEWIDCHDADQSVLAFLRRDRQGRAVIAAFNFTPVPREGYRIGCPTAGYWREIFNSDSSFYGGSNIGNGTGLISEDQNWMGQPHSLVINLPPLSGLLLIQD